MVAHLALEHVAVARPRDVRPEHERDVLVLLEALQDRRQPLVRGGRRVLGQERNHIAPRALDGEIARAAV